MQPAHAAYLGTGALTSSPTPLAPTLQVTPDGEMQSLQPKNDSATGNVGDSAAGLHASDIARQRTMDSMLSSMATTVTLQSYNGTVIDEGDLTGLQGSDMLPVYQLSARTGSAMYMAPEVFKGGCCCW